MAKKRQHKRQKNDSKINGETRGPNILNGATYARNEVGKPIRIIPDFPPRMSQPGKRLVFPAYCKPPDGEEDCSD